MRNFPHAKIGWLRTEISGARDTPRLRELKAELAERLKEIGLSAETVTSHPDVRRWREVYSAMGVKPSKYRSSIEALLRRVFKGDLWEVSPAVDCYDCVSALNLLPMGAHDIEKLRGALVLRYARAGEKFYPLGAGDSTVECSEGQIVYADRKKICCWLWNHRDARDACVDGKTKEALFIVDCAFETEWRSVEEGLAALASELDAIGCAVRKSCVVSASCPEAETE